MTEYTNLPPQSEAITETALAVDEQPAGQPDRGNSLWSDAWLEMRSNPLFWFSMVLILVLVAMAVAPGLFTRTDPYACDLQIAREAPSGSHWFGTDLQGCDVYARTIFGARSSILVGLFTTLGTTLLGGLIGIIAGYSGGWVDTLLSRLGEVFFAIPLLLGGIVILYSFPSTSDTPYLVVVAKVVAALVVLGWPSIARLMRSSVLQVKPNEYVQAARALGASPWRIITRHILPNAMAAVLVVATINLGSYIAVEATLSFLGIGLRPPVISWGIAISEASGLGYIQSAPWMLAFPSLFLSLTVLAFILLGEVIRDALDPKLR
ncbi:ABC transporter permease [Luteococcus sp. OSA5]|uniref:ABC transporter permease n=1 Tax=Luteococcus sp. OSA5 TaxID=3401630 RepID=UPI003B439E31